MNFLGVTVILPHSFSSDRACDTGSNRGEVVGLRTSRGKIRWEVVPDGQEEGKESRVERDYTFTHYYLRLNYTMKKVHCINVKLSSFKFPPIKFVTPSPTPV